MLMYPKVDAFGDVIRFNKVEREALAAAKLKRITGNKIRRIYGKNKEQNIPKRGFHIVTPLELAAEHFQDII